MTVADDETPDAWSDNCATKQVKVEVSVDPDEFYGSSDSDGISLSRVWVEIPTTEVDLWEQKDGAAAINRTAKVSFPTEWAGESVIDLVSAFDPEDDTSNFSYCRIWFRDRDTAQEVEGGTDEEIRDSWTLKHHGFIGGVGQSGKVGESKMWVYDYSELIEKVPFTASWNTPSIDSVVTSLIRTFNEETPALLVDTVLHIGPDADMDTVPSEDLVYIDDELEENVLGRRLETPSVRKYIPDGSAYNARKKSFFRDRHTMVDALEWLTNIIDAIWYIRPTTSGGQFVFDEAGEQGNLSRRLFVQDSIKEESTQDRIESSVMDETGEVSVIQNTALYEINPVNTVIVRGSGDTSRDVPLLGDTSWFPIIPKTSPSGEYPVATIRAEHLYKSAWVASDDPKAAEQAHLESIDSTEIEEAIRVGKKKLTELLENEEEGMTITFGNPDIKPYDVIESHYTCAERFPEDIVPIHYEVEEVKHHASGPETYKCTAYVSVFVGEQRLVVDQEGTGMEDIDTGEFDELSDEELEEAIEEADE